MFNNNERDKMDNLKVEIIRHLLMIETTEWLEKIKQVVVDGICAENDQDSKDKEAFAKWKAIEREKSGIKDEITF